MLIKNPLGLEIYRHDKTLSQNIGANSLIQITLRPLPKTIRIDVDQEAPFFTIRSYIEIAGQEHTLQNLPLVFDHFNITSYGEKWCFLINIDTNCFWQWSQRDLD